MDKSIIKKRLEQEYNATYVARIRYNQKEYIKAISSLKNEFKYVYYSLENNNIEKVENPQLINYFTSIYETRQSDIIY